MKHLIATILLLTITFFISLTNSTGIQTDGQGKRVLALLDSFGLRETHSTFFKSLKDRGFQVNFKTADDSDLTLSKYNEYLYDHVILFCPNVVEFGGNVSSKTIVDFIDAGGNVLIAASTQLSMFYFYLLIYLFVLIIFKFYLAEPVKEIAGECGVEFSDESTYVIDRFNTALNDDGHGTLIVADTNNLINNKLVTGDLAKNGSPFLYRGVG